MVSFYSSTIAGVLEHISINKVKPFRYYYRNDYNDEDLKSLAFSISEYGLLDPITVRNSDNDLFEVIIGIRRYNACRMLGCRKILCHIINVDDKGAYELSLMSNLQNKKLDPIEEATAFKRYLSNYNWGEISELAKKIGKSHTYIHKRLKLLDLSNEIKEAIANYDIEPSIAEELIFIKDKKLQTKLGLLIQQRKFTCKQLRDMKKNIEYTSDTLAKDDFEFDPVNYHNDLSQRDVQVQKLFDKMIIILKNCLRNIIPLIEDIEDNWMIYDLFMQERNLINHQIDTLIKIKKKLA
jgi:ParB family chromosome partitioning protein